ncbi:MAG: monovalent cation/H+ antiporter subunit D family protein [Rhizobiales bacterium]|nr:monovalent cation/H+ antiporter subunit D family protein [Hyphomicrobiales bacterium]
MTSQTLIILALVLPALTVLVIPLFHRQPNLRETITITSSGLLFLTILTLLIRVLDGERPSVELIRVVPDLPISFTIEPLGMIFAAVAGTLWIVNSIYSIGYMRGNNEPRQTQFYMCFALAISATMGIAFADNLFTLFLFYEILTLSTYPLVTHKGNADARAGGRKYLIILLGTSTVLLLPAIIWTWFLTGSMTFTIGGIMAGKVDGLTLGLLLALYVFGIGKAAIMPMHGWLPAAMVAPTPVSALLHAVAVVKAGVFTVVKVIIYIFGIDYLAETGAGDWLLYIAGFTILMASIIALRQDNLKRRLAFSTISQLSYVILAVAILSPISAIGAAMHIAAHAVSKITLFFAAGSLYTAAHITKVSQMRGIGRKMPWTMTAFAIGGISMIGLPPTAGFLGKWFMLQGAMDTGQWVAVGIIVVSTILNAGYFLPVIVSAFLRPVDPDAAKDKEIITDHGEAPLGIVIALTMTAAGTVLLFLFPGPLYELASAMVDLGAQVTNVAPEPPALPAGGISHE